MFRFCFVLLVGLVFNFAHAQPAKGEPSDAQVRPELSPAVGRPVRLADIDLELCHIPAGSFLMGSPKGEAGRFKDERQHQVTLTKAFWMGSTEVTVAQWQVVMGTTLRDKVKKSVEVHNNQISGPNPPKRNFQVREGGYLANAEDQCPMTYVSWEDAMAFCLRLTERERTAGRLPQGYAYTLPTEAQWEYVCRAGTTGALAGELNAQAWYEKIAEANPTGLGRSRRMSGEYMTCREMWQNGVLIG